MFHVEQYLLLLAALLCTATAAEQAYNPLPLSGDSEPAALECNMGLQSTLLGDHERAAFYFNRALEQDADCALARAGAILLEKESPDYTQRLDELQELLGSYIPTPAEALFINSLLKLACNEVNGAAADFLAQADKHPNDVASACWAISLLNLAGNHQEAAKLADRTLQRHPDEIMLLYLRGAVEETAAHVSDKALFCAQAAAILMRDSAPAELLYGKLLSKRGYAGQAVRHFHVARKLAHRDMQECGGTCSYTYLAAGLSEATELCGIGRKKEALALRRSMNAETFATCSPDAAVLHQWEVATLPLRSLVYAADITPSSVAAAMKVAQAQSKESALYQNYLQALQKSLLARCTRDKFQAEAAIAEAKLFLKHLNDAPTQVGMHAVVLQRAKYACALAIAAARTQLYKDTDQTWYDNIDVPADAVGRCLPPIVPRGTM